MIKRNTKIFFLLFLILILFSPNEILAFPDSQTNANTYTNKKHKSTGNLEDRNKANETNQGEYETCYEKHPSSKYDGKTTTTVSDNKYCYISNVKTGWKGQMLESSTKKILDTAPIAGTYVYVSLYEYATYTVSCYREVVEKTSWSKMKSSCPDDEPSYDENGKPYVTYHPCWVTCEGDCSCSNTQYSTVKASKSDAEEKTSGKKISSSFDVIIPEPNDSQSRSTLQNKVSTITTTDTDKQSGNNYIIEKHLYYVMGKTCLNRITGEVRYLDTDEECDEEEFEIEQYTDSEGLIYWPLFIPLNQKSNDLFAIIMTGKTRATTDEEMCINYLDNYLKDNNNDYSVAVQKFTQNFVDSNGQEFVTTTIKNAADYNSFKNKLKKGCKRSTQLATYTLQLFYNEEESQKNITFKGYAFTYTPIDINDPFPNVTSKNDLIKKVKDPNTGNTNITLTNYWYNWYTNYNNAKSNLKISESFEKVTYESIISNPDEIRELSSSYDDWTTYMNIDGTSNFIEKLGIVARNSGNISFYKLGCGPLNSVAKIDGKTNPLYMEECKEVTTK